MWLSSQLLGGASWEQCVAQLASTNYRVTSDAAAPSYTPRTATRLHRGTQCSYPKHCIPGVEPLSLLRACV
jgi:hypothetical protein